MDEVRSVHTEGAFHATRRCVFVGPPDSGRQLESQPPANGVAFGLAGSPRQGGVCVVHVEPNALQISCPSTNLDLPISPHEPSTALQLPLGPQLTVGEPL